MLAHAMQRAVRAGMGQGMTEAELSRGGEGGGRLVGVGRGWR